MEITFEQIEKWISFLNTSKKTAESKKNSILQLAFRRDMKPDKDIIDFYDSQIKCSEELLDVSYNIKRYLRKIERNENKGVTT